MFRTLFLLFCVLGCAAACRCRERSSKEIFCGSDWVGLFTVLDSDVSGAVLSYKVNVGQVFKTKNGAPQQGQTIDLLTTSHSASCGVVGLQNGVQYLLVGSLNEEGRLHMGSCGQFRTIQWNTASPTIKNALLNGTYKPCV